MDKMEEFISLGSVAPKESLYEGAEAVALLLCRERLLCPDIPREAHDICIPTVITEKGRLWAAE